MSRHLIQPEHTTVVLLSFEGPDRYSMAGGLGVRVSELAGALAEAGFPTHLIFIGDPTASGLEKVAPNLTLHRWAQWISRHHPNGVYQGEDEKVTDYTASVPSFVLHELLSARLASGGIGVVMSEEWHTAGATIALADLVNATGHGDRVLRLWNANNTYAFDHIDWPRLQRAATLTAVSRYMKQIMWRFGLETHVIPNGIPRRLLAPVDAAGVKALRTLFTGDLLLAKVARWDPDKRWLAAVEAVAELKARGYAPRFIVRGGIEPHGAEVLARARHLGLRVADAFGAGLDIGDCLDAIAAVRDADVINLRFFVPEEFLRVLFAAAEGVLANSGHEPFGLVGLEVMAAGGVAYVGSTGEDYAHPLDNAVVLDTGHPLEMVSQAEFLREHPEMAERLRRGGRRTAERYTWDSVLTILTQKLEYLAQEQVQTRELQYADA